jgi:sugar phosphate isomerase/epimerase
MDSNIPLVSIGFDGYDLEPALRGLARTDSRNVILCCIDGFTKHVIPEEMDMPAWEKTRALFQENGLTFYGLFGHCNLSDDADLPKLKKRMEYTRFMGGGYIDTNAGAKGTERQFHKNLPQIVELAEKLDLTVCLETHGDMLQTGKDCAALFKGIPSRRIRVSYDPANVYFYNRGTVNVAEDLTHALPFVGMVHFKGVNHTPDGAAWSFPLVQDSARNGAFDYPSIFRVLETGAYHGMVAIELEERFRHEEGKGFVIDPVWPQDKVVKKYNEEIAYLQSRLTWL